MRGGSRFYVDVETHEKAPGVTSVIGMLPKPFLAPWNAKLAAELAVDSFDFLKQMSETAGREAAVDYIKGAARRYTKGRADIGSDAHDMFERMIRGEGRLTEKNAYGEFVVRVAPDLEPYRRHFAEFLEVVQPELVRAEDVAWSDTHNYAGSFDAILRIKLNEDGKPDPQGEPALVVADWKTSKSTYADVALQMAAYAHADRIIDPEGNSSPMPAVDGACVLHVTPEQWALKPVRIDDEVFDFFLTLRKVFNWDREVSKTVLGRAIAKSSRVVTGTERRAR
jgi:hypothetical protein